MAMVVRQAARQATWNDWRLDGPWQMLVQRWSLLRQLIHREVMGRYRGSLLGTAWTLLLPLVGVAVYTLVFGFIFQQRWPRPATGQEMPAWAYPLLLWAGLALFQAVADVLQRATSIIPAQPNLVKKVVFPLEILPAMLVGTSLVPLGLSLAVVTLGLSFAQGSLPRVDYLLLALGCSLLWLQGLAWALAALGTFLRDLAPMVQALCPLLLFLSPVFYPVAIVPEVVQPWYWLNPLAVALETLRAGLVGSPLPPWPALVGFAAFACVMWQTGWVLFQRLRPEMGDVV
jgi:lipopolysaccharide transport system permease protein